MPGIWQAWGKFHDRFNVDKEPNEPNRFGWIVEIDPFDPTFAPVKHTALGRFRHEGAETIAQQGRPRRRLLRRRCALRLCLSLRHRRAATTRTTAPPTCACSRRARCRSRASTTTARVDWLPLVFGEAPLTPDNGFKSQADVLIDARLAADLLGATRMDRPEDVQPNPVTGKVYVILTNNEERESRPRRTTPTRAPTTCSATSSR